MFAKVYSLFLLSTRRNYIIFQVYKVTLLSLWLHIPPSNLGYPCDSIVTLAVPSYQNVSLVNSSSSPLKAESQLSFLTVTTPFYVDQAMTWQCWRYSSTEHHYYLNTCRNHATWSYPSVSLTEDCRQHQLDPLKSAYERSRVPRIFLIFISIHSFIFHFIFFSFNSVIIFIIFHFFFLVISQSLVVIPRMIDIPSLI